MGNTPDSEPICEGARMKDQYKTKKQLIEELEVLRNQLVKLKKAKTNRKRSEETLRESEETFKALAENANDGILITVGEGIQAYANRRAGEITGYSVAELLKSSIKDLVHPDELEKIMGKYRKRLAGEPAPPQYETIIIRKDGKSLPIELTAAKTVWQGQPANLVIFRDITERKQMEQALAVREQEYCTLLENIPDLLVRYDPDLRRIYVNPAWEKASGLSAGDVINVPAADIPKVPKPTVDEYMARLRKVLETGTPQAIEFTWVNARGVTLFLEYVIVPEYDQNGKIVSVLAVGHDLTERKRVENIMQARLRLLEFASSHSMDELLTATLDEIEALTGSTIGFYHFLEADQKTLSLQNWSTNTLKTMCTAAGKGSHYDIAQAGVWVDCVYERRPVIHNDYVSLPHRKGMPEGHALVVREVVVPILRGNLIKAITGVGNKSTNYNESDIEIVSQLGDLSWDITDRKRAEEALRESEEKYRTLFEESFDGLFITSPRGKILDMNKKGIMMFGYDTKDEILSLDLERDVYAYPPDRKRILAMVNAQGTAEYEVVVKKKNGEEMLTYCSLTAVKDEQGAITTYRGIIRDITERKKVEEALRESEEKYRDLVENINDILYATDEHGTVTYIAPTIESLSGYTTSEIIGRPFSEFVYKEDIPFVLEKFQQDVSGHAEPNEYRMLTKSGVVRWVRTSSRPFFRETRVVGLRGVTTDVTDRKRAEEESEALREQLRQSQKMEAIGRLAGGIAHDFNNLLTIIKGYSQLSLIELKEDSPLKGSIEQIDKATDRAADLVRQLLAFSRRQILEMRVLDLNTTLANLHNMLRRLIGEDIELTMVLAEDLGRVKTDLGWIEQAIMNLVVNAKDAMPKGGKLTIETANVELDEAYARAHVAVTSGRYVMIAVSDTGAGMTPEVRERLFEPFFSTKEKDKGTGLGLSTVYGIVKQSGGNIWVYSEPGNGSTFKIYLPRVDEPLEQPREKLLGDELLRGSETIRLVEDEEEVRKLAVRVLERQGYKVLSARDGDEALLVCERHKDPIHLMLTDVVMPGMSGHEVAKRSEPSHPEMKVLYMSGYTDNAIVMHGVLVQGVNYIQKPFTVNGLTKKVREVLEQ